MPNGQRKDPEQKSKNEYSNEIKKKTPSDNMQKDSTSNIQRSANGSIKVLA